MKGIPRHPRAGTVLGGKWQVEGVLGEGGTGTVFVARHANGSRVAIKVLHRRLLDHPALVTRFRREGALANRVGHADIVRVFDDGVTDDGCPFLVTELLEGETLEQERLRMGGALALGTVVEIGRRLCAIVQAAHDKGVLHRDIKPQNLFRTRSGELKVLDFGLGCEAEPTEPGVTSLDSVLGTVGFMAPEQAQGRWDLVDEQTDVWAIGATLLKLSTGLDAHEGATPQQRLALAATAPVRRLDERARGMDPRVSAALDRAMAFSRGERFSSARLLGEALGHGLSSSLDYPSRVPSLPGSPRIPSGETGGSSPSAPHAVGHSGQRSSSPRVFVLAAAAVIAVIVSTVGGAWAWRSAAAPPARAPNVAPSTPPGPVASAASLPLTTGRLPSATSAPLAPSAKVAPGMPTARPSTPTPVPAPLSSPTHTTTRCTDKSQCMANASCDDKTGYCRCTKTPGRLLALACGGACVPQDRNHCGGCTAKCGATETCTDPVTGSPFMKCLECSGRFPHAGVCGELCVDLDNDALNCGRCGNNCRVTEPACRGKLCMCQLGKCVAR